MVFKYKGGKNRDTPEWMDLLERLGGIDGCIDDYLSIRRLCVTLTEALMDREMDQETFWRYYSNSIERMESLVKAGGNPNSIKQLVNFQEPMKVTGVDEYSPTKDIQTRFEENVAAVKQALLSGIPAKEWAELCFEALHDAKQLEDLETYQQKDLTRDLSGWE